MKWSVPTSDCAARLCHAVKSKHNQLTQAQVDGVQSVHELHVWSLDQRKSIASAHIVIDGGTVKDFTEKAKIIMECLHAYGIHSATLQPEVLAKAESVSSSEEESAVRMRRMNRTSCQLVCSSVCSAMQCCP